LTLLLILVGVAVLIVASVALYDLTQRTHAITRNFPVIGRVRYWLEELGPPLRQYWFAGDLDERPYDRVTRSWVYASAKGQNNLVGFGAQADHGQVGRILVVPSLYPTIAHSAALEDDLLRPRLIGAKRGRPYQPRRFANISGMSFGALSANAVRALSRGARLAGCYMSTGEGSLSPYHLEGDCDILYQIGPAKFGCRAADGRFDDQKAAAIIALPQVKMVEIKLSQGAKPGKGGLLPKEKITSEIAGIRGIPMGVDCHSPNGFEEFHDATSLLAFIARVRKLTDKPVGLKMVVGSVAEIAELCRTIREQGDGPDFIVVDGAEGGSGAAPLALAAHVGLPLRDGLIAVDSALRREGLRDEVCLIASGKIATGADVAIHIALGADLVHIARGFMLSLGCIQAMRCHTNSCPTGIATQSRWLQAGLDPTDKGARVHNYALALERDLQMITRACGLTHPEQLNRTHLTMNVSPGVRKSLAEIHPYPARAQAGRRYDRVVA